MLVPEIHKKTNSQTLKKERAQQEWVEKQHHDLIFPHQFHSFLEQWDLDDIFVSPWKESSYFFLFQTRQFMLSVCSWYAQSTMSTNVACNPYILATFLMQTRTSQLLIPIWFLFITIAYLALCTLEANLRQMKRYKVCTLWKFQCRSLGYEQNFTNQPSKIKLAISLENKKMNSTNISVSKGRIQCLIILMVPNNCKTV